VTVFVLPLKNNQLRLTRTGEAVPQHGPYSSTLLYRSKYSSRSFSDMLLPFRAPASQRQRNHQIVMLLAPFRPQPHTPARIHMCPHLAQLLHQPLELRPHERPPVLDFFHNHEGAVVDSVALCDTNHLPGHPAVSLQWRHVGAIVTFMAESVLEKRSRQSLRLNPKVWASIDRQRGERPGLVSRNTWITEAILEKLSREQDNQKPRRSSRA
jgi:hypothetical protein